MQMWMFCLCSLTLAAVEPPVAGRPANFSGAVGNFHIASRAVPTELQAEEPLIFTIHITGTNGLRDLQRPDLRRLPRFAKQFHIENLADHYLQEQEAHEFEYRLRPRNPSVKEIPSVPFVYFKPGIVPEYLGYQTTSAPAIPLKVRPREEVSSSDVQGAPSTVEAPDRVYQIVEGPSVLRSEETPWVPRFPMLALLVLSPPVLCTAWYLVWRRLNPDAVRLAVEQGSRAAREAVAAVEKLRRLPAEEQAARAEEVVLDYLRKRLDLELMEPTPPEVVTHLQRHGASLDAQQEADDFFKACGTARFAPGLPVGEETWPSITIRLILALEAERWPLAAS
jgi:hypothetical protein